LPDILIACFVLAALPVQAAERTINVDGLGKVSAKLDRAKLCLNVIANRLTASEGYCGGVGKRQARMMAFAAAESGVPVNPGRN